MPHSYKTEEACIFVFGDKLKKSLKGYRRRKETCSNNGCKDDV
jgi:hypothetical protein